MQANSFREAYEYFIQKKKWIQELIDLYGASKEELISTVASFEEVEVQGKKYVKYSNAKTLKAARKYCGLNENPCEDYFEGGNLSDCAHFVGHCLEAGGIKISQRNGPKCSSGGVVRVLELVAVLGAMSEYYQNVKQIDYDDAIIGDVGFLNTIVIPSHAVIIAEANKKPEKTHYYAHSKNRCGKMDDPPGELPWHKNFGGAFRLEDHRS